MNDKKVGLKGHRLKSIREKRGFTQEAFAAEMGVAYQQVWRWETGKNDPSGETLVRMANVLGVTTDYLLGLVDEIDQHLQEENLSPMERRLLRAVRTGQIYEALEVVTALTQHGDQADVAEDQPAINR